MRAQPPGLGPIVAALSGALLITSPARSSGHSTAAAAAAEYWVDGKTQAALSALDAASRTREGELNRGVVRLYAGQAADAVSVLAALHERERGWTPVLRWLARAQAELGRPEALDSANVLLARPDADVLDQLWAGGLFLRHERPLQARSAFRRVARRNDGIELAWRGIAEAETQLGNLVSAREADDRVCALHAGGPIASAAAAGEPPLGQVLLASAVPSDETLRYDVKYLFFRLASVTLRTGDATLQGGAPARRVVFSVRSNDAIPFFHIDSRFESVVG